MADKPIVSDVCARTLRFRRSVLLIGGKCYDSVGNTKPQQDPG